MSASRIITAQTGTGPMTALDIATLPEQIKLRIISAAFVVAGRCGGGQITAEETDQCSDEAIDELCAAVNEMDPLFTPVAPGPAQRQREVQDRYPVIRDGEEVFVLREHMTGLELTATIRRLRQEADADKLHADLLAGVVHV